MFRRRFHPVWLASYPRSGNTFLRIILERIFRLPTYSAYNVEGQEFRDPSAEALSNAPLLPRRWRRRLSAESSAQRLLIKTHGQPTDDAPAIYLVRDGRAAVHSYYHYHKQFAFEQPSLTEVIAGACEFGAWSGHYQAWQPRTRPGTLFLRYEELVTRPGEIIPQIAEFLGAAPAEGRLPTFEELNTGFPEFFRRGQNADALAEWSPGQNALFNLLHGQTMQELGYNLMPSSESALSTVAELAGAAACLHELYLEQLSKLKDPRRWQAEQRRELKRLRAEVKGLKARLAAATRPAGYASAQTSDPALLGQSS